MLLRSSAKPEVDSVDHNSSTPYRCALPYPIAVRILGRARRLHHLTRSTVNASISAGTRIKVLAASSRVARLTFTVELAVLVGVSGRLVGSGPSLADTVVVAALAVSVARRLVATVGALELDVAAALVACFQRDASTSVTARRAVAVVGLLTVGSVIAVHTVATVRPTNRPAKNRQ